jgi:hypothetical protein
MQWSFCGKDQPVFLSNTACSQKCDKQGSWQQQQCHEIKQPDTFFRRHPVKYDKNLFGSSVFEKKEVAKSGLKRSPESENLLRDFQESDTQSLTSQESDTQSLTSQESDTQSLTSQESDTQSLTSRESSSSGSSRAPTPENQILLLVPTLITAAFKHPRPAAAHLRVIIPRVHVAKEYKPLLMAKVVSSFEGLDLSH